jgi:hypothetical protein
LIRTGERPLCHAPVLHNFRFLAGENGLSGDFGWFTKKQPTKLAIVKIQQPDDQDSPD